MTRFWTISLISAGSALTAAVIGTASFVLGKRAGIRAHAAQQFQVLPNGKIVYNKMTATSEPTQQAQQQTPGN